MKTSRLSEYCTARAITPHLFEEQNQAQARILYMTIKEFLEKFIEGYLFCDLENIKDGSKLKPKK